jgi:hypothetical protein
MGCPGYWEKKEKPTIHSALSRETVVIAAVPGERRRRFNYPVCGISCKKYTTQIMDGKIDFNYSTTITGAPNLFVSNL